MNYAQETIHRLDATINPAGVEASMRMSYATLDSLSLDEFRVEIEVAKTCEEAEEGYLEGVAVLMGLGPEYGAWERSRELGVDSDLVLAQTYAVPA